MKEILKQRYKDGLLVIAYMIFYLVFFFYVENRTGVRIHIRDLIMPEIISEIFSAFNMALVLGTISPNKRTRIVKIPVAIPTATFPHNSIANEVAREEALKFTILLPIKIALSILE